MPRSSERKDSFRTVAAVAIPALYSVRRASAQVCAERTGQPPAGSDTGRIRRGLVTPALARSGRCRRPSLPVLERCSHCRSGWLKFSVKSSTSARVLRHRPHQGEQVRLGGGHEVRPVERAEHEWEPPLVDPAAEGIVERTVLEDRLAERPGGERRGVGALPDERVDRDMGVPDRDRVDPVGEPRRRLPHRRRDRALQDAAGSRQTEAGRIRRARRSAGSARAAHRARDARRRPDRRAYGVPATTSSPPPGTASNRSAVALPSNVRIGISMISPCPGETPNVTPSGLVYPTPVYRPAERRRRGAASDRPSTAGNSSLHPPRPVDTTTRSCVSDRAREIGDRDRPEPERCRRAPRSPRAVVTGRAGSRRRGSAS